MRNKGVDVFVLVPFAGATQLKRLTFFKMAIADNFLNMIKSISKERSRRRNHDLVLNRRKKLRSCQ